MESKVVCHLFGGGLEPFRQSPRCVGDIANHAERADPASGSAAPGEAGEVMEPPLPVRRMQVAILSRNPINLAAVQLPDARPTDTWRSSGWTCSSQNSTGPEALPHVRGDSADLPKPIVQEAGALTIVHFVIPEAGQVCSRCQASLARAERLFGILAIGDINGDTHHRAGPR